MDIILQLLGVAYFIFALFNLSWAVLLLPLFFPAYLLKFDLGGVPFPLIEVFIYGTFLAWVIQTGLKLYQKKLHWSDLLKPFRNRFWLAVLGIVIAAVISTFVAPQAVTMMDGNTIYYGRKVALGILKSWIIAPVLMLILFNFVMRSAKDMTVAMNSYVVSSVLLAAWGVYQILTKQYVTPDGRASGPFNSANYLALFITPALFYALVRLKDFLKIAPEPWWKKIISRFTRSDEGSQFFQLLMWAAAFFLLLFALLFTQSYAAFLAFFVACVLWFWMQHKKEAPSKSSWWSRFPWKLTLLVVVAIILIVTALIVLDPTKWELFFHLTTRTSSGVRVEIYTIATHLVLENPFFGIGLGMFPAVYQLEGPRILGHSLYELNMLHPHDIFLAFWLNLGLLGFVSFLWILKECFSKAWKFIKTLPKLHFGSLEWFHAMGLTLLVIILVHGLVDTPFFKNDLALLFWLVTALIVVPLKE